MALTPNKLDPKKEILGKNKKAPGVYGISGEDFVVLATAIALYLSTGKNVKQVRFLSNLAYQISVSLGAISTQRERADELIV